MFALCDVVHARQFGSSVECGSAKIPTYSTSTLCTMKTLNASILALSLLCLLPPATAVAGFAEGIAAYNKKDYEKAIFEWKPLAAHGNAEAQINLGVMYDNGNGVAQRDSGECNLPCGM